MGEMRFKKFPEELRGKLGVAAKRRGLELKAYVVWRLWEAVEWEEGTRGGPYAGTKGGPTGDHEGIFGDIGTGDKRDTAEREDGSPKRIGK